MTLKTLNRCKIGKIWSLSSALTTWLHSIDLLLINYPHHTRKLRYRSSHNITNSPLMCCRHSGHQPIKFVFDKANQAFTRTIKKLFMSKRYSLRKAYPTRTMVNRYYIIVWKLVWSRCVQSSDVRLYNNREGCSNIFKFCHVFRLSLTISNKVGKLIRPCILIKYTRMLFLLIRTGLNIRLLSAKNDYSLIKVAIPSWTKMQTNYLEAIL